MKISIAQPNTKNTPALDKNEEEQQIKFLVPAQNRGDRTGFLKYIVQMKQIIFFTATAAIFFFPFLGCKGKNTAAAPEKTQEEVVLAPPVAEDAVQSELESENLQVDSKPYNLDLPALTSSMFHTDAHAQFLDDPLEFKPIPDYGIDEKEQTAVVASNSAELYPESAFFEAPDGTYKITDENMKGEPIPFATLLKLGKKLTTNEGYADMFRFQKNYNHFYKTEYNGKTGYVFSSDLYGLTADTKSNRISAELYRTNGKYDAFHPISGYKELSEQVAKSLENDKLAIQIPYTLYHVTRDDMIDLYRRLDDNITHFITTDLAAHSQHLVFDRMLQHTEEVVFVPRLLELCSKFIDALKANNDADEDTRNRAIMYFQVAQALLRIAPEKVEGKDWEKTITYNNRDIPSILAEYPAEVAADVQSILDCNGTESIFSVEEDFSQYKPRGHYTKNGILEAYFRASMWFGRIHFIIASSDINELTEIQRKIMLPAAMFIVDTVHKKPSLYAAWETVFNPITSLIGLSDDLGFSDVLPLWQSQNVTDFKSWEKDEQKAIDFIALCHEKLRPPAIQGASVFSGASEDDSTMRNGRKPPMGWRFLGQRFTWDSFIHEKTKRLPLVKGLDIMAAFGSKFAQNALGGELEEQTKRLADQFDKLDSDFWNSTYYNQVLYQIKAQATFEQGAGFYFTQSPLWNIKSQIAAHGTWAELRHDTILYVKQSYAEKAGDGDFEPTFRTLELPEPVHYIEPNLPFWEGMLASAKGLYALYDSYRLLDDDSRTTLKMLSDAYEKTVEIVKKEVNNEPITNDENSWIPTIINIFEQCIMVHNRGDHIDNKDMLKMACIADVFTNADDGICLEVGVGTPLRLHVPLNDSQGGKRIAVGYGFSYAEFAQPQNKRLTDEEWKERIYGGNIISYMPDWEKSCITESDETFDEWGR